MLNTILKITNNLVGSMEKIVGKDNVLSSYEERFVYSTDSTNITSPKDLADVIVFPQNTDQVSQIMKYANAKNIAEYVIFFVWIFCFIVLPFYHYYF